jgi:hypothetical protein
MGRTTSWGYVFLTYTNMMNPVYHTVGVGLVMVGSALYLTNDFSD